MKILSLGLDNSILKPNSALAKRAEEYGFLLEKYNVIVPNKKEEKIELNEKIIFFGSGGANKISQIFRIFQKAEALLKTGSFDIMTVQDPYYLGLIALILAKKYQLGLEIQIHGLEKFNGLRKLIFKFILPRADSIRVVSRRVRNFLVEDLKIEDGKITVVPIYSQLRIKNYELKIKNDNKFIFLTVGRFVPVKNIGMQIDAFSEVIKKYPNIELWIVGDGEEKNNYELRITNYELKDKIKLFSYHDDLDGFYKEADVFLLTSNYEGWGLVVIEAASFGLPIIMTDVGCAGEVIKNRESGLVIPVGSQKALEGAMMELIENKELREKMGKGAEMAIKKLPNKEETNKLYMKSWAKALKSTNNTQIYK